MELNFKKHFAGSKSGHRFQTAVAAAVVSCMMAGSFLALPVSASDNYVDGDWDTKESKAGDFSGYAFVLSEPIEDCEELTIELAIEMQNGAKCKDWVAYAKGTSGSFKPIGNIFLEDGDGEVTKDLKLKKPMDIESIMVVPKVNGSFSWEMGMAIYSDDAEAYEGDEDEEAEEGELVETELEGDWDTKESKAGDTSGYAYVLSEPIEDCEELKIDFLVEMQNGAKCKDWVVYAKGTSGAFKPIGNVLLEDGDGETTVELSLKKPMDIESIMIVPKINGSFSWEMGMLVYAMLPADGEEADEDEEYDDSEYTEVEGDWDTKESKAGDVSGYAYVLSEPLEDCEALAIDFLVEMQNGAKCKDWVVYAKGHTGSFKPIGNIFLEDGDGEASKELKLKKPMDIEYIMIVPKVAGSFSWEMGMAVYA